MSSPALGNRAPGIGGDIKKGTAVVALVAVGALGAAACNRDLSPVTSGGPAAEQPNAPNQPIYPTEAAPVLPQIISSPERSELVADLLGVEVPNLDDLAAEAGDRYGNSLLLFSGPEASASENALLISINERFSGPIDELQLYDKLANGGSSAGGALVQLWDNEVPITWLDGKIVSDPKRTATYFHTGDGHTAVFTSDLAITIKYLDVTPDQNAPLGYSLYPSHWDGEPSQAPTAQLGRLFG